MDLKPRHYKCGMDLKACHFDQVRIGKGIWHGIKSVPGMEQKPCQFIPEDDPQNDPQDGFEDDPQEGSQDPADDDPPDS